MEIKPSKRLLLEKEVWSDISVLLSEELGVSNDVEVMTKDLQTKITSLFPSSLKKTDENGVGIIQNEFYYKLFECSFYVKFICYNFKTKDDANYYLNTYREKYPVDSNSNFTDFSVTLNLYAVCGTLLNSSASVISHELMHVYEYLKRGFMVQNPPRGAAGLYYRVIKSIHNGDVKKNDFVTAIYTSFNKEQVAFTNQYAHCLANSKNPSYEYQIFDPYNRLLIMKKVLNNFDDYKQYCEDFKITEDWAYNFLENGYKTYLYKLSRVIYKYVVEVKEGTLRTRHNSGTIHII